jgi:carboxypeptidase C (cathepsin A)
MSNKRWLDNLVWTGAKGYLAEEMKPWSVNVDGKDVKAGDTKTAHSLGGGKLSEYFFSVSFQIA